MGSKKLTDIEKKRKEAILLLRELIAKDRVIRKMVPPELVKQRFLPYRRIGIVPVAIVQE